MVSTCLCQEESPSFEKLMRSKMTVATVQSHIQSVCTLITLSLNSVWGGITSLKTEQVCCCDCIVERMKLKVFHSVWEWRWLSSGASSAWLGGCVQLSVVLYRSYDVLPAKWKI